MFVIKNLSIDEVVDRIISLNDKLREFWTKAKGWAPIEAAKLLSKSRLDWQVSLSKCLKIWLKKPLPNDKNGCLILAWANLGSLLEGTMKLFLSVWYKDYKVDVNAIRKKGKLIDPDGLQLEPLRQFFNKRIWRKGDEDWNAWIQHIQYKRNAIHAYKSRNIGNFNEFLNDIRKYLKFVEYINSRLPSPYNELGKI